MVFTDLPGVQRGKLLTREELVPAWKNGRYVPGSMLSVDVTGLDVVETGMVWDDGDADRLVWPAPGTLKRCPWATLPQGPDGTSSPRRPTPLPFVLASPSTSRSKQPTSEPLTASLFPSFTLTSVTTGHLAAHCDGRRVGAQIETGGVSACRWEWQLRSPWLAPGDYALAVHLCTPGEVVDELDPALILTVLPEAASEEVASLEFNMASTVSDFSLTVSVEDEAVRR